MSRSRSPAANLAQPREFQLQFIVPRTLVILGIECFDAERQADRLLRSVRRQLASHKGSVDLVYASVKLMRDPLGIRESELPVGPGLSTTTRNLSGPGDA